MRDNGGGSSSTTKEGAVSDAAGMMMMMVPYEKPPNLEARQKLICRSSLSSKSSQILLILMGVQGSGKSWFAERLLELSASKNSSSSSSSSWVVLCQDEFKTREKVHEAARQALVEGRNVIIDRMHLTPDQRSHFTSLGFEFVDQNVSVHGLYLSAPHRQELARRVKHRTNHPGGVMGENGVRMAMASLSRWVPPTYQEGFDLMSAVSQPARVDTMARLYAGVGIQSIPKLIWLREEQIVVKDEEEDHIKKKENTKNPAEELAQPNHRQRMAVRLPSICLGTMGLGRRSADVVVQKALKLGFLGFDTAPTYNNEDLIGSALPSKSRGDDGGDDYDVFVIAKIPKRATTAQQVRDELAATLNKLQRNSVDLLLLHWPSDVLVSKRTLSEVWLEMEYSVTQHCTARSVGVCNFNVAALRMLLPHCRAMKPAVNQIERHPALPQWDVIDFCAQHDIVVQAHTPLGQGKLLEHPVVMDVARQSDKLPAQVLLQWNLQQGVATIPKSTTEEHNQQNLLSVDLPPLSMEHMQALNDISGTQSSNVITNRYVNPPFMKGAQPWCWSNKDGKV